MNPPADVAALDDVGRIYWLFRPPVVNLRSFINFFRPKFFSTVYFPTKTFLDEKLWFHYWLTLIEQIFFCVVRMNTLITKLREPMLKRFTPRWKWMKYFMIFFVGSIIVMLVGCVMVVWENSNYFWMFTVRLFETWESVRHVYYTHVSQPHIDNSFELFFFTLFLYFLSTIKIIRGNM